MSRTAKQYDRLESLEIELASRLRLALTETVESGYCWVFDSPERTPILNTWMFKKEQLREILQLASEVKSLRQKLSESVTDGILGRYEYWADHHHSSDENRLGPKRLAEAFLREIDDLHNDAGG